MAQDVFWHKSALAGSGAVTKQRARSSERLLCLHSLGSVSNCRGAVAGVALGGGSHGCTKVRAAVTSQAKDVDGEQHELFRRVRLACLQSTICPGGSLPHMSRSLWLFTAYGCTKVFAGQRQTWPVEGKRASKGRNRLRSGRRNEWQRNRRNSRFLAPQVGDCFDDMPCVKHR